jgi:type IV secretion system protein VirB6
VAPPLEEVTYSPTFAYRCLYLTQPRSDLNGVGTAILSGNLPNGFVGSYSIPIARFLKSSFHYTSTMVGCVQDMISVTLTQNIATSGDSTFLQIVQNSLRPFILGTLVLYVALVGIKIMMSQGELKRHEYIMFLVKFAMVMWMNTTSFWYISQNTAHISSNDGPTGNSLATATAGYGSSGLGVFNALIQGQNVISSMFVQSLTTYDPLGLCTYYYGDSQRQLLSDTTNIPPSAATGMAKTNGYGYVNMTVWDMIDCKLANYLNYGSCQYDGIGILLAFFLGLCSLLIPDSVWLLMFLCAFGYLLIGIVYKMARISILVSIVIATLVITSPVFTCFMLFDKTMPIFQAWVKALIGYLLFPGFIMAFFCLTVLTLDSVYYGNLTLPVTPGITRTQQLVQACQGSNSIFCATVSIMGDPCNNDISNYPSQYSLMGSFIGMLMFPMMNPQVMAAYFLPILRITLMILLFSLLTDSSIAFLSTLAGTSGIETVASGGVLAGLKDSIFGPLLKSVAKMGGSKKG